MDVTDHAASQNPFCAGLEEVAHAKDAEQYQPRSRDAQVSPNPGGPF